MGSDRALRIAEKIFFFFLGLNSFLPNCFWRCAASSAVSPVKFAVIFCSVIKVTSLVSFGICATALWHCKDKQTLFHKNGYKNTCGTIHCPTGLISPVAVRPSPINLFEVYRLLSLYCRSNAAQRDI